MIGKMLQCDLCINRSRNKKGYFCKAFDNKPIPEKLYRQEILHDQPYKGDNGILFKKDINFNVNL